jgi:hypothetical protein
VDPDISDNLNVCISVDGNHNLSLILNVSLIIVIILAHSCFSFT